MESSKMRSRAALLLAAWRGRGCRPIRLKRARPDYPDPASFREAVGLELDEVTTAALSGLFWQRRAKWVELDLEGAEPLWWLVPASGVITAPILQGGSA